MKNRRIVSRWKMFRWNDENSAQTRDSTAKEPIVIKAPDESETIFIWTVQTLSPEKMSTTWSI